MATSKILLRITQQWTSKLSMMKAGKGKRSNILVASCYQNWSETLDMWAALEPCETYMA